MKAQYCATCEKKLPRLGWCQMWDEAKKAVVNVCRDNYACQKPYLKKKEGNS